MCVSLVVPEPSGLTAGESEHLRLLSGSSWGVFPSQPIRCNDARLWRIKWGGEPHPGGSDTENLVPLDCQPGVLFCSGPNTWSTFSLTFYFTCRNGGDVCLSHYSSRSTCVLFTFWCILVLVLWAFYCQSWHTRLSVTLWESVLHRCKKYITYHHTSRWIASCFLSIPNTLYYIILYYIILCYIISYYIISYHIISYHIILYYIMLCYVMLCYVMLYYIILYYIILYYIIWQFHHLRPSSPQWFYCSLCKINYLHTSLCALLLLLNCFNFHCVQQQ